MADYRRLMEATWDTLYASPAGREEIVGRLPGGERALMRAAFTEGFDQDAARRRSRISPELLQAFPLTFRVFYGMGGAAALNQLLDSPQWRGRRWEPGATFPALSAVTAAFHTYFSTEQKRMTNRAHWVGDAFRYESALLGLGPQRRGVDRGPDALRLRPGAWVAECPFDAEATLTELVGRCAEVPWGEAALLVKPRPRPFVTLVLDEGDECGTLRHYRVLDEAVDELRWAWDPQAPIPDSPEQSRAIRDAAIEGLLV